MWQSVLLGILVGLAMGWLLFADGSPDASTVGEPVREREAAAAPASETEERDALSPAELRGRPSTPPIAGSDAERVASYRAMLRGARARGGWPEYLRAMELLAGLDDPEADRVLVEVLGDATLVFPVPMAERFAAWLENSETPGIADAVRARIGIEAEARRQPPSLWTHRWAKLLGRHGSEADLARLLEVGPLQAYRDACGAFMTSGSAAGRELARATIADRDPRGPLGTAVLPAAFEAVLAEEFEEGLRLLDAEKQAALASGFWRVDFGRSVSSVAKHVPEAEVGVAVAWILEQFRWGLDREPPHYLIVPALGAFTTLQERGLDTAGLEEVVDWAPRVVLDVVGRGGPAEAESPHWNRAVYLLLNVNRLSSAIVVDALEAALPHLEGDPSKVERAQWELAEARIRYAWTPETPAAPAPPPR